MNPTGESPIICFLDESATDDKQLDDAVLGGIVMNRKDVPELTDAWTSMLREYKAESGLHMIELGPKGKLSHLTWDERGGLLAEAVRIVNHVRIFTFGACLSNRLFEQEVSEFMRRKQASVYFAAFMMCMIINHESAAHQNYHGPIDYILDSGNRFRKHVEAAKPGLLSEKEMRVYQVGGISFSTDTEQPALQAADLVAWATRRKRAGQSFRHAPGVPGLFDKFYVDSPLESSVLKGLADVFRHAELMYRSQEVDL